MTSYDPICIRQGGKSAKTDQKFNYFKKRLIGGVLRPQNFLNRFYSHIWFERQLETTFLILEVI